MYDLIYLLPFIAGILSVIASVYSTFEALLALRAKDRVRRELEKRSKVDAEIRNFRQQAKLHKLTRLEVEVVSKIIEKTLFDSSGLNQRFSDRDKRFVERGLRQPSRLGVERYVNDLLTHAHGKVTPE